MLMPSNLFKYFCSVLACQNMPQHKLGYSSWITAIKRQEFNSGTVVAVYLCRLAFLSPLKQWFSTICTVSSVFCIIVPWSYSQYLLCFKSSIVSLITQLIKQATFKYKRHVNVLHFNHIMVFHLNFGWSSELNIFVYRMQKKWGSSKPQSLSL